MSTRPLQNGLPMYAFELVDELDALYPPRCISENESPTSAHRYAGKRELVEHLLALKAKLEDKNKR